MDFRLGKLAPVVDVRTLRLSAYLAVDLPKPPPMIDYYRLVSKWPMFMNDRLGDCTCASAGHAIIDWNTAAGHPVAPTDADILVAYNAVNGGHDSGAAMLDVLKLWRKTGIGTHQIKAFTKIEPNVIDQVKHAVHLFGIVYIGMALPNYAIKGDPFKTAWTRTAFASPNSNNGHAISVVGYDSKSLTCVTWGRLKTMSWSFFKKYTDEAYAILSLDWLNKLGRAPSGLDLTALQSDLDFVTH